MELGFDTSSVDSDDCFEQVADVPQCFRSCSRHHRCNHRGPNCRSPQSHRDRRWQSTPQHPIRCLRRHAIFLRARKPDAGEPRFLRRKQPPSYDHPPLYKITDPNPHLGTRLRLHLDLRTLHQRPSIPLPSARGSISALPLAQRHDGKQ